MGPLTIRHQLGLAAGALLALAAAAPAQAAGYGCSASALRIAVLGAAPVEPATANAGGASCASDRSTLADPATALGAPVSAGTVAAATTLGGPGGDAARQSALAVGGVSGLRVLALPSLPVSVEQIIAPTTATVGGATTQLSSIPVPVPPVVSTALTTLGLSTVVTADATRAVQSLVPATRALSSTELVGVQSALAYAAAACRDGRLAIGGAPRVAGLTIAGEAVPSDQVVTRSVGLLGAQTVDFSTADPSLVSVSSNATALLASPLVPQATKDALNTAISDAVRGTLAALPTVSVPAIAATVTIAPGQTSRVGDSVTQSALLLSASVAGVKVVDAAIGIARVSADGIDCAGTPAAAELQCTKRKLVLVDVLERAGRVLLTGVADTSLAGRTVDIVFGATGERVAEALVAPDGSFETTAPLPPRALRDTNVARYRATLGRERSLDLKLRRRMIVSSMTSRNGLVTITGRVVGPLTRPVAPITITQRVSCNDSKVVKRFRPRRDGSFRVTVAAPKGQGTAVYRLATSVRPSAHSHRLVPTFTLPRAVDLRG